VENEDGAFVTSGERSHLYYVGDAKPFKNFELKVDVMTQTKFQRRDLHPHKISDGRLAPDGFETQVKQHPQDWKKTGSLYDVVNVKESPPRTTNGDPAHHRQRQPNHHQD